MFRLISLNLFIFLGLSACSLRLPFLHQQDIAQGNVYSAEALQSIQVGMERTQVRRLLGTPQLSDPFRPQEDVYAYRYFSGTTGQTYQGRVNISYENDYVAQIEHFPVQIVR